LIEYHDVDGAIRIYIPESAVCTPKYVATEFPMPGDNIRKECSLREELIRDIHENGHFGRGRTLESLSRYYYWTGMSKDVQDFVKGCKHCQRNKAKTHKRYGMIQPIPTPLRRWSTVAMDFIPDLPRSHSGYNGILVIIDKTTKRANFIPVKTTYTAERIAEIFYDEIYKHHGMPRTIISDRDKIFRSKFWTHLFSKFGTRLAMSTAYSPQTDGQSERTNRTLEEMLRSFTNNKHRTWDKYLTAAEFAYNNMVHEGSKFTPFYLDTGQHPLDPHASVFHDYVDDTMTTAGSVDEPIFNYDESAQRFYEQWDDDVQFATSKLNEAAENVRRRHSNKALDMQYKVGDRVWLDTKYLTLPNVDGKMTVRTKFDPRRTGPYVVNRVLSNGRAYRLTLHPGDKFHPVQPVSRLEPVTESIKFPDAHDQPPPVPVLDDLGREEFEVEKIIRSENRNGRKFYKVRWRGYGPDEDQWLPISRLRDNAQDLVDEFHTQQTAVISYVGSANLYCFFKQLFVQQ
jgi:hypothetical protein